LELAANMRDGDRLECLAAYSDPVDAIWDSLASAALAWTGVNSKGRVVFMAGVSPEGRIFLLSTGAVDLEPLAYCRSVRGLLREGTKALGKLLCYVDSRYEVSLRWLRGMGFMIDDKHPLPVGVNAVPFYPCTYGGA
jgi:hypothetical protein